MLLRSLPRPNQEQEERQRTTEDSYQTNVVHRERHIKLWNSLRRVHSRERVVSVAIGGGMMGLMSFKERVDSKSFVMFNRNSIFHTEHMHLLQKMTKSKGKLCVSIHESK